MNPGLELKSKQICRFCLTTNRPLSNIYSKDHQDVPLSLQIIACVSIEVFPSDKMPSTICGQCSSLMDFCYRFKQMCKEADSALKLVPTTRIWPEALDLPQFPIECAALVQKPEIVMEDSQIVEIINDAGLFSLDNDSQSVSIVAQEEDEEEEDEEVELEQPLQAISIPLDTVPDAKNVLKILTSKVIPSTRKSQLAKPKVLNQSVKKPVKVKDEELRLTQNEFGNVDILMDQPEVVATDVFPCTSCERSFPLKQLLEIHERNHTREREAPCNLCTKKFFTKYDLAKHMLTHTGERPFKCVVCAKAFSRTTLLHRHQKIHSGVPRFECEECDRFFFVREELEKHKEKHTRSRPFQCPFCPKSFAFKQGLERHEVVHADSHPFPCEYCGSSFNTRNKLLRHLTAHAGNRPFPCKFCPKSYLMSHHLSRHLRSHTQRTATRFKCYMCTDDLNSAEELIDHLLQHAPTNDRDPTNDRSCPLCHKKFKTDEERRRHIKLHTEGEQFACEFCDLLFAEEEQLLTHSQEHADEQRLYDEDLAKTFGKQSTTSEKQMSLPRKVPKKEVVNIISVADLPAGPKKRTASKAVAAPEDEQNAKINSILSALPKGVKVKRFKMTSPAQSTSKISNITKNWDSGTARQVNSSNAKPTKKE